MKIIDYHTQKELPIRERTERVKIIEKLMAERAVALPRSPKWNELSIRIDRIAGHLPPVRG